MDLQTFKDYLFGGSGAILVIMTLVQISPIKINPWTWLAEKIGRAINREVYEKIESIGNKVNILENKTDKREADNDRYMVLRFGDEVRHGVPHSKEHYDSILKIIHDYETYCYSHPKYKNNVAVATIRYIEETYQKHLEKDDFL